MASPNLSSSTTAAYSKVLSSRLLPSGDTTIYTTPVNHAAKIATLALCNTTASPVTVSVSLVPAGGTLDGSHTVVSSYSLAANDTTQVSELVGAMMGDSDYVSVNAGTNNAVTAVMTGVEYS